MRFDNITQLFESYSLQTKEEIILASMKTLEISREEAEELYEFDNGNIENEEVDVLTEKAKPVLRSIHKAESGEKRNNSTVKTVKISDEKAYLADKIVNFLNELVQNSENNVQSYQILKEKKLFCVIVGDKTLKIDISEQRKPKK